MPGRRGGSPTPSEAALAATGAATVLMAVAVALGALAPAASQTADLAVRAGGAWLAVLGAGVLVVVARRGGDMTLAYGADLAALLLVAGALAGAGAHAEVLLAILLAPIVHAAVFYEPERVAVVGTAAITLAAAATLEAGGDVLTTLAWMVPATAAAGLGALPVGRLRTDRAAFAERESEARRLADEDGLTGVANYRAFWRTLKAEVARAQRHGQPFTLIMLDLDHFKRVNDEHGHLVGDATLRAVAEALRRAVRVEDLVCRQGGDEFAVLAVAAGQDEASSLAQRLVAAVSQGSSGEEAPEPLTVSVGWATFGEPARCAETLVEHGEAALREAKHARRGLITTDRTLEAVRSAGACALRVRASQGVLGGARPTIRLAVLGHLARALSGATTERAIAETAVAYVAGAIDAERVAMLRRARNAGSLALVAVSGGRGARELHEPLDRPPLSIALRERRAVLTPRAAVNGNGDGHGAAAPGGILAVPLLFNDDLWGALEVESHRDPPFADAEIETLEAMAETVGRALAVAQMLAELAGARWETPEDYDLATERSDAHGRDVACLAERVGSRLALDRSQLRQLYVAALFHEIGTVCTPPGVLRKQGQLTDEEFAALRPHPLVGQRMLGGLPGLDQAADIVRAARERYDGAGYPDGLAGEAIPLAARILHACDAFVAMTTPRPYRPSLSVEVTLEELRRNSSSQFDPAVVEALVDCLETDAEVGVG